MSRLSLSVKTAVHDDDKDGVSTKFVIRNRTLVQKTFTELTHIAGNDNIEDIDKLLSDITARQDPKDFTSALNAIKVYFKNGEMRAEFRGNSEYRFLTSGASQLAQAVLPPYHWRGLKQLTTIKPDGERIAGEAWNHFASQHDKKMFVVRCIRVKNENNTVSPAIRALVSPTYGLYSNREFIQDMRYFMAEFGIVPVLGFTLTDQAMRIDFVGIDQYKTTVGGFLPEILETEPLPIVSAWNSEVGRGKVGLRAGLYNVQLKGGMSHWDDSTQFTWIHRGGAGGLNLKSNISKAYAKVMEASMQILDLYSQSKNVEIPDMEKWVKDQIASFDTLPESLAKTILEFTTHPKTTPGNKLATILDAMMLISSTESDIFRKADIEAATSRIMSRGLEFRVKP